MYRKHDLMYTFYQNKQNIFKKTDQQEDLKLSAFREKLLSRRIIWNQVTRMKKKKKMFSTLAKKAPMQHRR